MKILNLIPKFGQAIARFIIPRDFAESDSFMELCESLRIPQIVKWLNKKLNK